MKYKNIILYFLCLTFVSQLYAQSGPSDNYQGRLYRLCKVWGYVKYFHERVNTCQVNWDSALVATVPIVEAATDSNDFNTAVLQMLQAAGSMPIATTPPPDLSAEIAVNVDTGWINDPYFSQAIRDTLNNIRINFRPAALCNMQLQNPEVSSYLNFPGDSIAVTAVYPDEAQRLLIIFRFWNILNYFNPNEQIIDMPWDSTLLNNVLAIAQSPDSLSFYKTFLTIAGQLDDAHVAATTGSYSINFPGLYAPLIEPVYIPGSYVVAYTTSAYPIRVGDVIDSVNGLSMPQWEDSLRPYFSSGNDAVFRRNICIGGFLCGAFDSIAHIVFTDSTGAMQSADLAMSQQWSAAYNNWYDKNTVKWKTVGCDIGYVNPGNMQESDIVPMYDSLHTKSAIIFDMRYYPYNIDMGEILSYMMDGYSLFSQALSPDATYPGYFNWQPEFTGSLVNATPYTGKVIFLINEETQSAGEFGCMQLQQFPNALAIGSQTAGADGNVTSFNLSSDVQTGFTSLGIYYPNGINTQRRGILPDIEVYPTIAGIRAGKDELLDTAIAIACGYTGVQQLPISAGYLLYPNPAENYITIQNENTSQKMRIEVVNLLGAIIMQETMQKSTQSLDVSTFAAGFYFVNIYDDTGKLITTLKWGKS